MRLAAIRFDLFSHPKPFECNITARSERARELIMSVDMEHDVAHRDALAIQKIFLNMADE